MTVWWNVAVAAQQTAVVDLVAAKQTAAAGRVELVAAWWTAAAGRVELVAAWWTAADWWLHD